MLVIRWVKKLGVIFALSIAAAGISILLDEVAPAGVEVTVAHTLETALGEPYDISVHIINATRSDNFYLEKIVLPPTILEYAECSGDDGSDAPWRGRPSVGAGVFPDGRTVPPNSELHVELRCKAREAGSGSGNVSIHTRGRVIEIEIWWSFQGL